MNEKIFTSTKLVHPGVSGFSWQSLVFMKTLDTFTALSGSYGLFRVWRDGTLVQLGTMGNSYAMLGRVNGLPAWWNLFTRKIYAAYELSGLLNVEEILNPSWDITTSLMARGAFIDDRHRIFLSQPAGGTKINIYNLDTGEILGEIVHNFGEHFVSIAWVQQGQVAGMCKTGGRVAIMDYLSSTPRVLTTGKIDPFVAGAYDCTFRLFVTLGADFYLRIYTGDLFPHGLSAPAFFSAPVYGLKANQVSVRLTGENGEPLPNWWVNWALEGVGGGEIIGALSKYGSLTDAEGYAYTHYIGPSDGATGQCKIKARVVLPA